MKSYQVETTGISEYPFIVFSTSYVSPLSSFLQIQKDILLLGFKGDVLFDLLLSNGYSRNRFLVIPVDNGTLEVRNVEILTDIPLDVLQFCGNFHQSHLDYVRNSCLLQREKNVILNSL